MPDILVQLEVTEANGGLSRDVIVAHTITFFNLHRAIQYCVKPRQSDSTVDGKAFNFHDVATNKPIKAAKSAALNCNKTGDHFEAAVGDEYIYEADGKRYTVKIADISLGDGKYYVPRCIGGRDGPYAADLDATNGKLLVRRFSKAGAGKEKEPPAIWCRIGITTNAQIMNAHMRHMRGPLHDGRY